MSDFNSSFYTPPYIPPSYFAPSPAPPMITAENPGGANAYYQQQQQQIANSGGAGWSPWNAATSPNTAPSGMTYPGAGMVESYPSFGEAQDYGGQNDPFSGGYSPYQQSAQQQVGYPQQSPSSSFDDRWMPGGTFAERWPLEAIERQKSWGEPNQDASPAADFSTRFPVDQSPSPAYQPPDIWGRGTTPTPYFDQFLRPDFSQYELPGGSGGAGQWIERGNGTQVNTATGDVRLSVSDVGDTFAGRFGGAEQPQLPSAITEGGYPRWDQRWDQIGDPYTNVPLNNALWQRGMDAGPQMVSGGGSGQWIERGNGTQVNTVTGDVRLSVDRGDGSDYNPFQQYQSGGYNPFAPAYENDLYQILRGIDQGAGGGQQNYPSWQSPGDTLTPQDRWIDRGNGTQVNTATGDVRLNVDGDWRNAMNQMPQRDAIAQAIVQQPPSMADFQSPANSYDTFQKGPTYDWQSSIPAGRNDPLVINAILKGADETGLPPAVIAAVFNMESGYNPQDRLKSQFGIPQMSENMWADNPFRGTMGGVDFATFRDDPVGDKQIAAYTDWLIRGNKLNRDGIDVASVTDPVMQAAMLQAIQFAGNSSGWRNALAQGNMNTYVTTEHPQAKELRQLPDGSYLPYPTIDSMYSYYDKILSGWKK